MTDAELMEVLNERDRLRSELAEQKRLNRTPRSDRMKVVYIAGPIRRGDIWENEAQADDAMLALMRAGFCVINPMLSCWAGAARVRVASGHTADSAPHPLAHGGFRDLGAEPWLTMDLELVARSDALLRLPGESTGADGEVKHANKCKIPVMYSVTEVVEWFQVYPAERGKFDLTAAIAAQAHKGGVGAIMGRWPGDETDEEVAAALFERGKVVLTREAQG